MEMSNKKNASATAKVRSRPSATKQSAKSSASKRKPETAKATRRKSKRTSKGRATQHQPRQLFPFAEAIDLAKKARALLDLSQPVIFHGSRHPKSILALNALVSATRRAPGAEVPPNAISCTRSLHVALYWAMLERRIGGDESRGAVFVLDRTRLAQKFRLQTYRDSFWDHVPERSERKCSECEERIRGSVLNLHRYLVDVLWIDEKTKSVRSRNRERDLRKDKRRASVRSTTHFKSKGYALSAPDQSALPNPGGPRWPLPLQGTGLRAAGDR
jgi:hypothetical protein